MHAIPLGNAIAVAAALLAVAAVFVVFVISSQKKYQARLDLLRYAVERGVTLDIELINKISLANAPRPSAGARPGRGARVAGVLIVSYGIGFAIFACFIGATSQSALIPMLGVATLLTCFGIGFLIVSRMLRREARDADPNA
jgi:hypothetical protein